MTKEQANALYNSKWWEGVSAQDIAAFQLSEDLLCVEFGVFQRAVEEALGRPVGTHEFADRNALVSELMGDRKAPTTEEIMNLIPAKKRIVVGL